MEPKPLGEIFHKFILKNLVETTFGSGCKTYKIRKHLFLYNLQPTSAVITPVPESPSRGNVVHSRIFPFTEEHFFHRHKNKKVIACRWKITTDERSHLWLILTRCFTLSALAYSKRTCFVFSNPNGLDIRSETPRYHRGPVLSYT